MNWAPLFWMLLLLLANGFFVAAEFAYITARRNVLERTPGRPAKTAAVLNRDLSLSLAGSQLGITMASLGLGAVAEPAVAAALERALGVLALPEAVKHGIALVIALLIVVFLHMVVGEMAPKNIAIANPERLARALALPFRAFVVVFRPLIVMLNGMANGVLRLVGVEPVDRLELGHSAEDLAVIIASGRQEGVIEDFTHRLLAGAIIFGDRDASEVMIPRPDVISVSFDTAIAEIEEVMRATGHSRVPIHDGDLDNVVGFVHVKDLMRLEGEPRDRPLATDLIRAPLFVPESAHIKAVLDEMRRNRSHFAIVVDEHGSTAGIITMEDIAEELVGEIRDEHDRRERRLIVTSRGTLFVDGSVRLDQLSQHGLNLSEGDYETIGGLIMDRLGRLPSREDIVEEAGWRLRVLSTDGRRVRNVEVSPIGETEN